MSRSSLNFITSTLPDYFCYAKLLYNTHICVLLMYWILNVNNILDFVLAVFLFFKKKNKN